MLALKFFPRPIIVGFTPFGFTVCTLAIDYVQYPVPVY